MLAAHILHTFLLARYRTATAHFPDRLELPPSCARARRFLIYTCLSTAVLLVTTPALPQHPATSNATQFTSAEREIQAGNFAEASARLDSILRSDSHAGADAYRLFAFAQYKQGNSYQALDICEQGIVIYPNSATLSELYLQVLRVTLSPHDQQARLEERVLGAPNSAVFAKALGELLLSTDSTYPRAYELLSRAAALAPDDAEAHFFSGEAACLLQSDDVCVKELRRAHELAPANQAANVQLYTMIAVSEDKQAKPAQAAADFSLALEANRKLTQPNSYAAMKYVSFLAAQGHHDQAMRLVEKILRWDPNYGPAHFELAKALTNAGKREEAIAEARKALAYAQSTSEELRSYHYFLARTYFALGQQDKALPHQKWVESHPQ